MAKLKRSEAFTVEREREIQQVVESVNELAQIMKDLSVLVIDQGTTVDRIAYNIQNIATTVKEGFKQLLKVERTQKQGGMVMCASVLVIMCFQVGPPNPQGDTLLICKLGFFPSRFHLDLSQLLVT